MQETAEHLTDTGITMPVQWCFKSHLKDGRVVDILLRRVKEGNETPIEIINEGDAYVHLKGRYSTANTLIDHLQDETLNTCQREWIGKAMHEVLEQIQHIATAKQALWELFAPKGKIEIYSKDEGRFAPQYINGNFTLKLHATALAPKQQWISRLIAQHLDYPFGPGERRFSTSRLFDLCFTAEKVLFPKGLASAIDGKLEEQGLYQPARHTESEHAHVSALLEGHSAAIRTSYERVLQRERFVAFIQAALLAKRSAIQAPILKHYLPIIEIDLTHQAQNDYKDYPKKTMDQMASAIHVPLITIFKAGNYDRRVKGNTG